MNKLHIITVATKNEGYYDALINNIHKINIITLGFGQKWTGFIMKFNLINEYLNNLDNNDIVIFSDAYDVLLLQDSDTIINKFKSFNKPIVISKDAEHNSLLGIYFQSRIFSKCKNTYINSGLYIGYVWALKLLFDEIYKYKNSNDDQIMLINICNNSSFFDKYIAIDYDSLLFYTTSGGYGIINFNYTSGIDSDIINNKLIIKKTNQEPSFVHGPGNTNLDLLTNIYKLPSNKSRNKLDKVFIYSNPEYLKYIIYDILISLIIFMTIIIILKSYS